VDWIRLGRSCRALRLRRHLRQTDVATRAGVSRATISNIERGHLSTLSVQTLMKATAAVGAEIDLRVRWHGAELDRLLDEGHARLTDHVVRLLERSGWECVVEATFSIAGERGFDRRSRATLLDGSCSRR
jgi:transcriptional regulator with XRE-family HTH domain